MEESEMSITLSSAEELAGRLVPSPTGVRFSTTSWSPWVDARPVATSAAEARFVADLARRCEARPAPHTRADVTAVLNALRSGLALDELLERAPGLRPGRLYGAHLTLDTHRASAVEAWEVLASHPTVDHLERLGADAARAVPVLVNRLRAAATIDPALLPRVAAQLVDDVARTRSTIARTESELDRCLDDDVAAEIGRTLYDPTGDCLFARNDHLPTRVGALVPRRVAALLGESGGPARP
jgi:hypothetical protein